MSFSVLFRSVYSGLVRVTVACGLFAFGISPLVSVAAEVENMRVPQIYQTYCASCHGREHEGGLGGSLADGVWKHGDSDEEIFQSIKVGNVDLGMDPWEGVLSDEQIRGLVIYLREREQEFEFRERKFPTPSPDQVATTDRHNYRTEIVADGLDIPWSIAFLPDGRYLIAERPGPLRVIEADGTVNEPVRRTPRVVHHGQGGMMEVALHPDFEENGWIYLAYSDGTDRRGNVSTMTTLARGRVVDNEWTDNEVLWRADREFYTRSGLHFGTRIVFQDGYVFFVIGDRGGWHVSQDLSNPSGNVFRLHDDGRIPEDNPFVGRDDALPEIWSYGHRNPQGLAFDLRNGDLYSTEHGPRGGDEFNHIQRGLNYGWPVVTHGMNYDGTPITEKTEAPGMEPPVIEWTPSIAACGLAVCCGTAFPNWRYDFFAGGLASQELRRLRVQDRQVVEEEIVVKGAGRIRDVRFGPTGNLYLVINDPHRVLRLLPAE